MGVKTSRTLSAFAVLITALGYGCGDGTEGDTASSAANLLCDGSDEPRLLFQYGYEVERFPGLDLLFENGYGFLVVNGKCRFWGTQRPFNPVRTGTLNEYQASDLVRRLRLGEWQDFAGSYCSVPEGGMGPRRMQARFDDNEIVIDRECEESEPDRVKFVDWILQTSQSSVAQLEANHSAIDGPVRFVLVRDSMMNIGKEFDKAASWPLEAPAHQVSVYWEHAREFRETERSILAEGEDAAKLRELLQRFRRGEFELNQGFIPIEQDTWLYRLYARDTIPLEDDDGLWTVTR